MAIENHPRLDDGSPFPTLFWLTCPILVKRASALESEGELARMTSELHSSGSLRGRLADAIERYRARRDAHEDLNVEEKSPPGGGPNRVKCLHAHLAHELSDPPNPIGASTLEKAGWPDCVEPCFRVP